MENEILVEIRYVYGHDYIYPACNKALIFAKLVRQKTLTKRDIDLIKDIGFKVRCKIIPREEKEIL